MKIYQITWVGILLMTTTLLSIDIYAQQTLNLPYSNENMVLTNEIKFHNKLSENQKNSNEYFNRESVFVKGAKLLIKKNKKLKNFKDAYIIYDYDSNKMYKCYQYQMTGKNGEIMINYVYDDKENTLSRNVHIPGVALEYEGFSKLGKYTATTISYDKRNLNDKLFSIEGFEVKSKQEMFNIFDSLDKNQLLINKNNKPSLIKEKEIGAINIKVKPSATHPKIIRSDYYHSIFYRKRKQNGKLLLFLTGTGGKPNRSPLHFFETALDEGYQIINLSYINTQSVSTVCMGENLKEDNDCAENFRMKRVFGDNTTYLIPDEYDDAIIPRLTKLLEYLIKEDPHGNWDNYIENGNILWNKIAVSGQSQGGGMACMIAKKFEVDKVITFSGGWDKSNENEIANWYSNASITPSENGMDYII